MTTTDTLSFLKQSFLQAAYVRDPQQGYIVVEPFNIAIDPDVLHMASKLWAKHYHQWQVDAIVGLPDAGSRLVSILAEQLRIGEILPSKRTTETPGAWRDVVRYQNASFTTGAEEVTSQIGFVEPGKKILIIDDVVAHGATAIAAIQALQPVGAEVVGMGVLFDKVWQGGIAEIKEATGVDTHSLIRIEEIRDNGEVILR